MSELVRILSLPLREAWEGINLVRTDVIDASGQPVTPDRMPPTGSYERFEQLLLGKGYAVMPALSFAPGPAVLPTSLAVVGEAPQSIFERSLDCCFAAGILRALQKRLPLQ